MGADPRTSRVSSFFQAKELVHEEVLHGLQRAREHYLLQAEQVTDALRKLEAPVDLDRFLRKQPKE